MIEKGGAYQDVEHPVLSIECKSRGSVPEWLVDAVRQARTNAPAGKLALVVLHGLGCRHGDDLVVIKMSDWCEWFGELLDRREE